MKYKIIRLHKAKKSNEFFKSLERYNANCTFHPDISISQYRVSSKKSVKIHKCYWKEEPLVKKLRPKYSKQSYIEMKLLGKRITFNTKSFTALNTTNTIDIPSERFNSYKKTFEFLVVDKKMCVGSKNN